MCLIIVAHRAHASYPLVVAANRDEWFRRPTAPASFWTDAPQVLAGRDLEQRGTWLGVTRQGRFAAITNYRDPGDHRSDAPSRGALVSGFLVSATPPLDYLTALREQASRYNGFSLFVGDPTALCFFSNREGEIRNLPPGVYGLSNRLLDVPWPKVRRAKAALMARLATGIDEDGLLGVLEDTEPACDEELPRTGVSLEWERKLSAVRIRAGAYGTRSSTVLIIRADGAVTFAERTFDETGAEVGVVREPFALTPSATAAVQP